MRIMLGIGLLSMSLLGCMTDGSPASRARGSCIISGCSAEVCSDQSVITPCLWHDGFVCLRDAVCERQSSGECDWTQTLEIKACLAKYPALPDP